MAFTGGQTLCLWMVILGCLAIIAGSAAPFWVFLKVPGLRTALGPWYYCVDTECNLYKWGDNSMSNFTLWFYVFHGAEGLCTFISILVLCASLSRMCGNSDSASMPAGIGLIAGLMGIGAAVLFYLETSDSLSFITSLISNYNMDWAFYVFASGTGVLTFFSIALLALPISKSTRVGPV